MPGLLIHIVDDQWVAAVANTEIVYPFAGDTLELQEGSVNLMAMLMGQGRESLVESVGEIIASENVEAETIVAELFETTDMIVLSEAPIYTAVGETLIEVLEEAGAVLLSFL